MDQPSPSPASAPNEKTKRAGFLRRCGEWLFSQRHFHFKLLSGTAAGVTVNVQTIVQQWLDTVALPEIKARQAMLGSPGTTNPNSQPVPLGNSLLDQARAILQSVQDDEQIVLNQRMLEQEWATQSTQILDFLPKLERSVLEMQKEKRAYLLTGDAHFLEAYQRAVTDFYTYNGYLSILVANSPSQAELLAEVRANIEQWINTSATPEINARR